MKYLLLLLTLCSCEEKKSELSMLNKIMAAQLELTDLYIAEQGIHSDQIRAIAQGDGRLLMTLRNEEDSLHLLIEHQREVVDSLKDVYKKEYPEIE